MTERNKDYPKILLLGHARSGKGYTCTHLEEGWKYKCIASSAAAAPYVRDKLAEQGVTYNSAEECYEDRMNRRDEWFNIIKELNEKDPTTLARIVLREHNVYDGMRSIDEFKATWKLFDAIIYVQRLGYPKEETMQIEPKDVRDAVAGETFPKFYAIEAESGDLEGLYNQADDAVYDLQQTIAFYNNIVKGNENG